MNSLPEKDVVFENDVKEIRTQFTMLVNNDLNDYVYLDSASTTLKPKAVIDAVIHYDEEVSANVHRGLYSNATRATELYENARNSVARFINAKSAKEIIFTRGTTESLNTIAHMLKGLLKRSSVILTSELEHHSNLVPWQMLCANGVFTLKKIELKSDATLNLDLLEETWDPLIGLVAVTHMSNVSGCITNIKRLIALAHSHGALVVIDAAQSIAHLPIDVIDLDCDFLAFSSHKMYGPTGCGVLYGKEKHLNAAEPLFGGGNMISAVWFDHATWAELPYKFEAGTPPIASAIGLGAAVNFFSGLHRSDLIVYEKMLTEYAINALKQIPNLTIYGPEIARGPVISFSIEGIHPHDIAQFLDSKNVAIRAGHHCAQPLMRFFGVSALSRMSFGVYTQKADIDTAVNALHDVRRFFL